jgi:hypothetical protein
VATTSEEVTTVSSSTAVSSWLNISVVVPVSTPMTVRRHTRAAAAAAMDRLATALADVRLRKEGSSVTPRCSTSWMAPRLRRTTPASSSSSASRRMVSGVTPVRSARSRIEA